ncbi:Alpha/Beta hydrolase protein [Aspergillus pseudotamarii]|uniref:Alpha/Beta hydrolase protein n=1 Tax=Aspergillus pseudotamarii TaxID=132259 RepID=A0A5N6SKI8_ASPPS|nr:Alpha/Beta hydrolase protein [Aspergillus pseudotamarii]KAE8135206.1 Alpha/Beta hydrolase protein [Aspergillus pseudotamarii]
MSRFHPFILIDLPYRVINNQSLEATILIPNNLYDRSRHKEKRPVMVRFHGGGFILGQRNYEPWFSRWCLDLAYANGAIIVSPDYRLLPESNGADILSDIDHFWQWIQRDLVDIAEERRWGVIPDLSRVLCCGESSGGCLAVYSALGLSSILCRDSMSRVNARGKEAKPITIKAVISISSPLDPNVPELRIPRPRKFMGTKAPPPRQAEGLIRNYIKNMRPGSIRTGQNPTLDMWELLLCILQQCYLPRLIKGNGDKDMFGLLMGLLKKEEKSADAGIPTWVIHGTEDTLIPHICSTKFAERLRELAPVRLDLQPGDHMFEVDMSIDEKWIAEGRESFLERYWP